MADLSNTTYLSNKSTVKNWSVTLANQPWIMTFQSKTPNVQFLEYLIDGDIIVKAYNNSANEFTFDFTNYVRGLFRDNIKQVKTVTDKTPRDFFMDNNLTEEVILPSAADGGADRKYTIVNGTLDCIYNDVNNTVSRRFLTGFGYNGINKKNTIIKYKGYEKYLYFKNSSIGNNVAVESDVVNSYNIGTDYDVLGIKVEDTDKKLSFGSSFLTYEEKATAPIAFIELCSLEQGKSYTTEAVLRSISGTYDDICFVIASEQPDMEFKKFWEAEYSVGETIRPNKSGLKLYLALVDFREAEYIRATEEYVEYSQDSVFQFSHIKVTEGSNAVYEYNYGTINSYDVIIKEAPDKPFYVRWINQFGGWDYYMFDHNMLINKELDDVNTLNIGYQPSFDNSIYGWHMINQVEYSKKQINTVTVKSATELTGDYKELSYLPFSTKIQHWQEGNQHWEDIFVEDYENSYKPCQQAGSIEFTFKMPNQYGLSYVR